MKLLTHLPAWLKNKYFISFSAFALIMLFLDKNDLFTQMARKKEYRELQQSKVYYSKQINDLNVMKRNLAHDPFTIEKLTREKYLMKRDNEDLFIVPEAVKPQ